MRVFFTVFLMLVATNRAVARDSPSPAAGQLRALLAEYEAKGGARTFAKRFLSLAEQHPKDAVAAEALIWIVTKVRGRADTTRALELLKSNHVDSKEMGPACVSVARSRSPSAEGLLRALLKSSPHAEVKAQACYHLAQLLEGEAIAIDQLRAEPDLAPRILQYYGRDYGKHLSSLDPEKLAKQREQVYETMLNSFPDVEADGTTLGKIARKELFAIRHLAVGCVAPDIEGEDIHGKKFKLSDFRGKVVMLSFWGHW